MTHPRLRQKEHSSFSSPETQAQAILPIWRHVYRHAWDCILFLFKMDQIYFAFHVLWCQYISRWVWFENNKHRFHKLMSPVINSNFPTSLNSDSSSLPLPWSLRLSALALEAGRQQTGKSNRDIDEKWGELERTTFAYKIQSSSCLFIYTLSLCHVTLAVEEGS